MTPLIGFIVAVASGAAVVSTVCLYAIATTLMDIRDLMEKKYEQHKHE